MTNKFSLAQYLYNKNGYEPEKLREMLRCAEESDSALAVLSRGSITDSRPVYTAVKQASHGVVPITGLCDSYSEYAELFISSLHDLVRTTAVVVGSATEPLPEPSYGVSQRITGAVNIACGLIATEDVFLEIASRYSGESCTEVDELAIDAVTEYINVINGLFAIDLAKRDLDTELELPTWKKNAIANANGQLQLKIATAYGDFYLVLAVDEFLGF